MGNSIVIKPVETSDGIKQFLDLPYELYRNDPSWRPPLRLERKEQLDPDKNPAARYLSRQLYLAYQGDEVLGRIAAFINPAHDNLYNDSTAFFGYFDCIDHPEVIKALLVTAEDWAIEQGRRRLVGPAQWGVNEEVGLLIDGYEHPNVVLMSYGKPYYKLGVEEAGFTKAIDMYAFQADLNAGYPRPKMTRMMVNYAQTSNSVTWRNLNPRTFSQDIELAMEIFNDAWSENWGFLPFHDEAIKHLAKEMKPLIHPNRFFLGYIDGKLAAFICLIPDLNELTRGFDGKLLPFNVLKLLWRLKIGKKRQSRVPLMGLKKEFHSTRKGLSLVAALCEEAFEAARKEGFTHSELGWILENNESMIAICKQASAVPYKTYRMYEKTLNA